MKNKNFLYLLLAMIFVLSLLTGCNGSADTERVSAAQSSAVSAPSAASPVLPADTVSAVEPEASISEDIPAEAMTEAEQVAAVQELVIENPHELPLTDTGITLSLWCDMIPPLFNYMPNGMQDNQVYAAMEERTGVHMEVTSAAITSAADQASLLIASGDYPDIWYGMSQYYADGIDQAVEAEIVVDLAEYKEYFPSFFTIIDGFDLYAKDAYTDEGRVGVLNGIWTNPTVDTGLTLRKDWMQELGLDTPKTLDEFHDVLTQFHDAYGATYYMAQNSGDPVNSLSQCYGVISNAQSNAAYAYYMAKDGETILFSPTQPAFRDYLETISAWYNEGLIYSDFISASDNMPSTDLLLNGQIGMTYFSVAQYTTLMGTADADSPFDLMAVDVPVLDASSEPLHLGIRTSYTSTKGYSLSPNYAEGSEEFAAACAWLDYLYTDEGSELCNFGVENVTFTYGENGEHVWTDLMLNNPEGLAYSWCLNCYCFGAGSFRIDSSRTMNNYGEGELALMDVWNNSENDATDTMPMALTLSAEESEAYSAAFSDIRTYVQQNIVSFITGNRSLEEYDQFVSDIEDMGIASCTQILQDALDRYNAR